MGQQLLEVLGLDTSSTKHNYTAVPNTTDGNKMPVMIFFRHSFGGHAA